MQTDKRGRLVSLALGTTAIFDVTGAVIYRAVRESLPPPPAPGSAPSPFQQATRELLAAKHEPHRPARKPLPVLEMAKPIPRLSAGDEHAGTMEAKIHGPEAIGRPCPGRPAGWIPWAGEPVGTDP